MSLAHAHCTQCAAISPEKNHGENAPMKRKITEIDKEKSLE